MGGGEGGRGGETVNMYSTVALGGRGGGRGGRGGETVNIYSTVALGRGEGRGDSQHL